MRDYGKIHTSFWSSETIRRLSDDGRLLALYLMTSPHTTIAGVFRLPDGYAAEDLNWTPARVAKGFAELLGEGFANRCETTKWVWIAKHLDWNPPENPNQRKAAAKCAGQIPNECAWKQAFMRVCGPLLGLEDTQETEPLANPFGTLSKPGTGTGTGTEEISEVANATSSSSEPTGSKPLPTIPCPYQAIIDSYHERLPSLPRCRLMSASRQRALRKLWGWVLQSKKSDGQRRATTADEALAWLGDYFARASENDFLMGRSPRSAGHEGWRCDLDFLLSEKGMRQVIERTQDAA